MSIAAVTIYVVACLVNSTYGRGFLCVHDDEVAAAAMGISPTRYKVTAFVIGAFFAGVAGALYAHHKQVLKPDGFDFMKSIDYVVMVILGGMGRTAGVVIAAVLLTVLPEFLRGFAEYRMIIYSLLIIVLMMTRPQGLFTSLPPKEKSRKWGLICGGLSCVLFVAGSLNRGAHIRIDAKYVALVLVEGFAVFLITALCAWAVVRFFGREGPSKSIQI
jgi:branched-subunit amino acid ABC-type transport system permease component